MYFNNTFHENYNYWNNVAHYSITYLEMCRIDISHPKYNIDIDRFKKFVFVLFSQILIATDHNVNNATTKPRSVVTTRNLIMIWPKI